MADKRKEGTIREAVGVFEDEKAFEEAIDELLISGFARREISLVASEHTVEEKLGHQYERAKDIEDDPDIPRTCYVTKESIGAGEGGLIGLPMYIGATVATGMVVASGGTMAAAVTAAALAGGAGGLIGGYLARLLGKHHADLIQEQIDHGGLLLWVRTRDEDYEKRAVEILKKNSGKDVHLHDIPV